MKEKKRKGQGKRALVIGACGFVGTHIVDLLVEKGYEVRATDLETANRKHIEELGVEFMPADITKPYMLRDVMKDVDMVFNIASAFNYHMPRELMEKINVEGAKNVCEAVLRYSPNAIPFVHWSTGEVYGYNMADKKYLPPNEEMTEEYKHITPGEAPYAKTKWIQEQLVWKYHREQGLPVILLRLGTIYGEGAFFARLINIFADLSGLGLFPRNVNFKWPLVHVEDVAGAALHLSKKKSAIGQVYNIVDDQNYTIADIVYAVAEYFSKELKDIPLPPLSKIWRTLPKGEFLMDIVRAAYKSLTDEFKKRGKKVWFDYDYAVAYIELILGMEEFADNFKFSNRKLKESGYKLKYLDIREALPEMMDGFKKEGSLVKNPGLKHLVTKGLVM